MSERIQVAIVINDFLVGGAQRLIVDLLRAADRDRFKFTLITLFDFGARETFFKALPADVPVYRLDFRGFADIRSWLKLQKIVRSLKPDIVFSHLFFANTVMRVLNVFGRYRTITAEHNTYFNKTTPQRFVDRMLAHRTWKIVAVSETVVDYTVRSEHIPREKFVVVHDGVDVEGIVARASESSRAQTRKELDVPEGAAVFISVARLVPQKNHKLLLDAFALRLKKYPDDVLLIVGGGVLESALKSLAGRLRIERNVRFLGVQKDPAPYYAASDVFISTSSMEGFGIAHIEAMACGLPIVTTKTGGPDRFVEDGVNGFFVEESAKDVAAGLGKAINASTAMKNAARATARAFDISRTVRAYEGLFRRAVSS